jgi:hypothetical protein
MRCETTLTPPLLLPSPLLRESVQMSHSSYTLKLVSSGMENPASPRLQPLLLLYQSRGCLSCLVQLPKTNRFMRQDHTKSILLQYGAR